MWKSEGNSFYYVGSWGIKLRLGGKPQLTKLPQQSKSFKLVLCYNQELTPEKNTDKFKIFITFMQVILEENLSKY